MGNQVAQSPFDIAHALVNSLVFLEVISHESDFHLGADLLAHLFVTALAVEIVFPHMTPRIFRSSWPVFELPRDPAVSTHRR